MLRLRGFKDLERCREINMVIYQEMIKMSEGLLDSVNEICQDTTDHVIY